MAVRDRGFTLLELLVVVAIIGVLASIAISNYSEMKDRALVAQAASELTNFSKGFFAFAMTTGDWPADSHNSLPPGMEDFIAPAAFNQTTPLGGHYNWEGPSLYPYAGLAIDAHTARPELIQALDNLLDDGDLSGGRFRIETNGRPTLIIEEVS